MGDSGEPFTIIVGAGPAGLLLGLLLARANIPVLLLDKEDHLDMQPRATHYAAPAVEVLRRAGVRDAVAAAGFHPRSLSWRTLSNERLAGIDHSSTAGDADQMICLPLNQLGKILLKALEKQPAAKVLWNHEVTSLHDDNGVGVIEANTPDGTREFRARYISGCDGANSKIRRLLFGDLEFPGKTWGVQVVATNVSLCCNTPDIHNLYSLGPGLL